MPCPALADVVDGATRDDETGRAEEEEEEDWEREREGEDGESQSQGSSAGISNTAKVAPVRTGGAMSKS